ncbi:hypothetical protein EBU99_09920 [bacterium]|nr:hypothetical protein [bacterium]
MFAYIKGTYPHTIHKGFVGGFEAKQQAFAGPGFRLDPLDNTTDLQGQPGNKKIFFGPKICLHSEQQLMIPVFFFSMCERVSCWM